MTETKNRPARAGRLCPPSSAPDLAAAVSVALAVRRRAGWEGREAQTALAASILNCMKGRAVHCPAAGRAEGCALAVWLTSGEAAAVADFADRAFVRALAIVCGLIAGDTADPTNGATQCHRHTEAPRWARAARPRALIGQHFFYAPDKARSGEMARGGEQGRA